MQTYAKKLFSLPPIEIDFRCSIYPNRDDKEIYIFSDHRIDAIAHPSNT